MTRRLYLTNAAPGYTPSTVRGAWDATGSAVTRRLGMYPTGAAATVGLAEANATNNYDVLLGRWISEPVPAAGTLAGTVEWIVGVLESNAAANDVFHVHIFATVGDSDTVRGTLLSDSIGATEWPTTAAGRGESTKALTSVALSAGDRIVAEIGYRAQNTVTTSYMGTVRYGGFAADLASAGTSTAAPGWLEFSDTNDVLSPARSAPTLAGDWLLTGDQPSTVQTSRNLAVTVTAGQLVVIYGGTGYGPRLIGTPTDPSNAFSDFEPFRAEIGTSSGANAWGWVCQAESTGTFDIGFSVTGNNATTDWQAYVQAWNDSDGIGSTSSLQGTGAPSLSVPNVVDDSALVYYWADFEEVTVGSPTWRTPSGASTPTTLSPTEQGGNAAHFAYMCADAGAAGAKVGGCTAPAGQTYSMIGVEILGQVPTGTTASAGQAAGTGAALPPSAGLTASAGTAGGSGTAQTPTVSTSQPAGAGSAGGSGAAQSPSIALTAGTGPAAGVGAARAPAITVTVTAGVAAATGAAPPATPVIAVRPDAASGSGAAQPPAVSTSQPAPAGVAAGAGAAQAPAVTLAPAVAAAAASGAAHTPTVRITTLAGTAEGVGEAHDAGASTSSATTATAGRAAGVGAAHDPTVAANASPAAGTAAGAGVARPPTVTITAGAGLAGGTGTAGAPTTAVAAHAGAAVAAGEAAPPGLVVTAPAATAAATGDAHDPTVQTGEQHTAAAGTAAAAGLAHTPVVRITVVPPPAGGWGVAGSPQVDEPVLVGAMVPLHLDGPSARPIEGPGPRMSRAAAAAASMTGA